MTTQSRQVHTFEEAITLAGNGRFQLVVLFVSIIALLVSVNEGLNMAFVLPIARCDLDISIAQQGLINSVGFIGVIMTSHLWGFLADTWGRKRVLRTTLSMAFISGVISSFSYTSSMLLAARLAVGMSIAGFPAAAISYTSEFQNKANRQRFVTLAVSGRTISISFQSLLALAILPMNWSLPFLGLQYTPWRLYLLANASLSAVALLVLYWLPESPKFLLATGRPKEALRVLQTVYHWNTGKPADTYAVTAVWLEEAGESATGSGTNVRDACSMWAILRLMWAQTWPLFRAPHARRLLMLFYVSFAVYSVAHGLYLWLPQILDLYYENMDKPVTMCEAIAMADRSATVAINETIAGGDQECIVSSRDPLNYLITTANGVCFLVLYGFVAMTINQLGIRNLIVGWLTISALSTLALIWTNNFIVNCVLYMLLNSSAAAGSVFTASATEFFPTHFKGMALSLILVVCRLGAIAGSNLAGATLFGHCNTLLGIDATLMTGAVIVFFLIYKLK